MTMFSRAMLMLVALHVPLKGWTTPPTPNGPFDYTWETDMASGPSDVCSGRSGSRGTAISAMREASDSPAPSYLKFDHSELKSNYVREFYVPSPVDIDPLATTGYDFWGQSNCPSVPSSYYQICHSRYLHYSMEAWEAAVSAKQAESSNTCSIVGWTENSTWYFREYSGIDLNNPRTLAAYKDVTLRYLQRSDPDGSGPLPNSCATPVQQERTFTVSATRTLDCPGGTTGEGGFLMKTQGTDSPYYYCKNVSSGEIRYHLKASMVPCPKSTVGNPCDAATGAKTETRVDYDGPGLVFARSYHSMMFYPGKNYGALGYGWRHGYERTLLLSPTNTMPVGLLRGDGSAVFLSSLGGGVYGAANGSGLKLKKVAQTPPGGAYIVNHNFTVYLPTGEREIYQCHSSTSAMACSGTTAVWQLTQLISTTGQVTTLVYDAADNNPVTVTDPFGHQLSFSYTAYPGSCDPATDEDCTRRLDYITGPAGISQKIDFVYGGVPAAWGERLTRVDYPDGTSESYGYTAVLDVGYFGRSAYVLSSITDGNNTPYAFFGYWPDQRARTTEHAGGIQKYTLTFNADNTTTVEDAAGNGTIYEFGGFTSGLRRPTRQTYPNGDTQEQFFESTGQGRLTDIYFTEAAQGGAVRGHQHFMYDTYHRTARHEAYGTSLARVTNYEYLNNDSDLLRFIKSPSVAGGTKKKWTEVSYCTTSIPDCPNLPQLPYQIIETTRLSDGTVDPDAPSRTTTLGWNAYGHLTSIDGPRADVNDLTVIEYWDEIAGVPCTSGGRCGQVKSISNAAGHVTSFTEYFADGRLQTMTDPNGLVTTYTYDGRGRLDTMTETGPTGAVHLTNFDYDNAGQIDRITFPNGQYLDYTWTDAHLLDYITDNAGNKIDYDYDSRGNRTAENLKAPDGTIRKLLQMVYDVRNRLDTVSGMPPMYNVDFDAVGNLDDETDAAGHSTDYEYDALNRLTRTIDALNGANASTRYGYNVHDELTSAIAPNGATTTYVYDDLGSLRKEVSPDRGTTLYGYDAAGNLTCKADGRYSDGNTKCEDASSRWVYQYDALNRVTSIDYPSTTANPDVTFWWDTRPGGGGEQRGRLRQVSYEQGSVTVTRKFNYNAWGNVTWSQQMITGDGDTRASNTSYQYDGNGQISKITYPSGRVIDYVRWPNGRIKQVKATFNGVTTTLIGNVGYHPFGPAETIDYGNGLSQHRALTTTYAVDEVQLLETGSGPTVDHRDYARDAGGNITAVTDLLNAGNSRSYAYDILDRLSWDSGVSSTNPTYSYDANGNRLQRAATEAGFTAQTLTYAVNSNRLSTFNGVPVSHDGLGNLTAGPGAVYGYDAGGRLAQVQAGEVLELRYSGLGELAGTRRGGATEDYTLAVDGRALELDSRSDDRVVADWVWLDELPVAQIEDRYNAQGGYLGSTVTYLHADHLGTPRLGTDGAKAIVWRYESDGFGTGTPVGSVDVRLRLPGQVALGIAGLHYNYFRDYDPQLGRYVESDPIGLSGGINTYAYTRNRPTGLVDPLGLVDWNGSARTLSLIAGVGATLTFFSLESECACGKRVSVEITAVGPSAGLGLKVTGGASPVTFKDPWQCPDASALGGLFLTAAAGISFGAVPSPVNPRIGTGLPGLGLSASYTQMGDAISIGWPPGYTVGRDKSVSATLGSATVTGVRVKDCGCEK